MHTFISTFSYCSTDVVLNTLFLARRLLAQYGRKIVKMITRTEIEGMNK